MCSERQHIIEMISRVLGRPCEVKPWYCAINYVAATHDDNAVGFGPLVNAYFFGTVHVVGTSVTFTFIPPQEAHDQVARRVTFASNGDNQSIEAFFQEAYPDADCNVVLSGWLVYPKN